MPSLDLPFRSAAQLAGAIRTRKIGCLELLDLYLARVARHNPKLNAIVVMDVEGARKRAKAADAALRRGTRWGRLHGVPMTIKESYDVAGLPTTWGDPALKNNIAAKDSLAVERLKSAGVILFGKTNVPLMLADWQTHNVVYGVTNNPWDVTRGPGGSSGGSAAALAAGLTGIEAGSDIGASIRNPAHYCGVYGHKPTWGILSPRGHALPGRVSQSDISAIGPMARSAEDLALAMDAMAGPDDIDGVGWKLTLPAPRKTALREFKVAVMLSDPNGEVDAPLQALLQKLADFLAKQKVKVSMTARPAIDFDELARVYVRLLRSATSGRQSDAAFAAAQEKVRGLAPDDESYWARMLRGNTLSHRDWLVANEARHRFRLAWAEFFKEWDLLLCPTATSTAFKHNPTGERWTRTIPVNGRQQPETDQMFWAGLGGVCYLPGTVAPMGIASDGLPAGVQIIGPQYGDRTCIHFAKLLEQSYGGFVPPQGYA